MLVLEGARSAALARLLAAAAASTTASTTAATTTASAAASASSAALRRGATAATPTSRGGGATTSTATAAPATANVVLVVAVQIYGREYAACGLLRTAAIAAAVAAAAPTAIERISAAALLVICPREALVAPISLSSRAAPELSIPVRPLLRDRAQPLGLAAGALRSGARSATTRAGFGAGLVLLPTAARPRGAALPAGGRLAATALLRRPLRDGPRAAASADGRHWSRGQEAKSAK